MNVSVGFKVEYWLSFIAFFALGNQSAVQARK